VTDQTEETGRSASVSERIKRLHEITFDLSQTVAATQRLAVESAERLGRRDTNRLLVLSEVAERTGRHPDLLRRWCQEGRIPAVRVGHTWCVPEWRVNELGRLPRRRPRRRAVSQEAP
jgi:excisionase family DNA binding protein